MIKGLSLPLLLWSSVVDPLTVQNTVSCFFHIVTQCQLEWLRRVAYGIDRYLLAQSTKFGSHILWAKAKLFWRGYPILKVKVRSGQGQRLNFANTCL